jgi:hypothetical protein
MENKNEKNTAVQSKCKFLATETVQGIVHEFCQNEVLLKNKKCKDGERLHCMGIIECGQSSYNR